jgi:hypothetical protein
MKYLLNTSMAALALLLGANSMLRAQAIPTATSGEPVYNPGPNLPKIDGNFQYSLAASEIVQRGGIGNYEESSGSGTVEYLSRSTVTPFSMLYSGGLLYSTYSSLGFQTFQGATVTQGLVAGRWDFGASDTVSYLPQSPSTGLAGIPGQGNQGVQPIPSPTAPAQSVITTYGRRLSNTVSGDIQRQLNGRTSLSGSANYGILRFVDGNGYDSSQIGSQVGLNRQLNARTGVSLNAQYGIFSFTGGTRFTTKGLNVDFTRLVSQSLTVQVALGPQWVSKFSGLAVGTGTTTVVTSPARLNLAANVSASYTHRFTEATLAYSRGMNGGSGAQTGGLADSVSGQLQQSFGRDWSASASTTYTRTTGLAFTGTTTSIYGGTQLTRRLNRDFQAFVSFTAQHQNINSSPYLLNGTSENYAIGITFSPGALRLGQF